MVWINASSKWTSVALALYGLSTGGLAVAQYTVTVVNMIPRTLSDEHNQDSEPNIAVNPANPAQIAASAFTPGVGFCPANHAPIFISTDSGDFWQLRCTVPTEHPQQQTYDITLAFGGSGETLYAGVIPKVDPGVLWFPARPWMDVLRTTDYASATPMASIREERERQECGDLDTPYFFADQPYVESLTMAGTDRVYVGYNHLCHILDTGRTAKIYQSMDANPTPPAEAVFGAEPVEQRETAGQDEPPIRTALHPDGTVYAAFYRTTDMERWGPDRERGLDTADIVVVRDDNGGTGPDPYRDLEEGGPPGGDGMPGIRLARGIQVPWVNEHFFGQERLGPRLSLAVDPRSSATVYVAWNDGDLHETSGHVEQRIHLRRSETRGRNWSEDLRMIDNAINPTVAVNGAGQIGFLYQQLINRDSDNPRWVTHLEIIRDPENVANREDIVLADVPADSPTPGLYAHSVDLPYLGDYLDLVAVGETFYGVFAANNTPDYAHFPEGVTYLRNADFETRQLLDEDGEPVDISIDPFFFRVSRRYSLDICATRPWFCDFAPIMEPGRLTLRCRARDCLVVDFIDKNCQVKYAACPGCEPGGLCPPYYHIFLDELGDDWTVTLVDEHSRPVAHQQSRTDRGVVISFRPSQEGYKEGRIGNYRLVFQMGRTGKVGHAYKVKTRLEVSDKPFAR